MENPFSLHNKKAAVTGGLGRVGRGIVSAFSRCGCETLCLDIAEGSTGNPDRSSEGQGRIIHEYLDVCDLEGLTSRIKALDEKYGPLDIWVNSAYPRTDDWGAPPESTSVSSWRRNVDMQLNSYCLSANEIAFLMASRGQGAIVNVASIYGLVGPDFSVYRGTDKLSPPAYSAIKGGVIGYTKWLASYFGPSGVRVNAVCPGAVFDNQAEPFYSQYCSRTLLGRMAEAEEIGYAVVFLASEAASYITGCILPVDGGWCAV